MRTRRAFAAFTICALATLSVPDTLNPRQVEARPLTKP